MPALANPLSMRPAEPALPLTFRGNKKTRKENTMSSKSILEQLEQAKPVMNREANPTQPQYRLFGVLAKQYQAKTGKRLGKPANRGQMSDAIDALKNLGYKPDSTRTKGNDLKSLLVSLMNQ
jgi:hypothetical protein